MACTTWSAVLGVTPWYGQLAATRRRQTAASSSIGYADEIVACALGLKLSAAMTESPISVTR